MEKDHSITHRFDVTSDEAFEGLAHAFAKVLPVIEAQGYGVEYGGEMLYHPGQVGVVGKAGSGKSTFINTAVETAYPQKHDVQEKLHPSHDEARLVQVWKQWATDDGAHQIQTHDLFASASLSHMPNMRPPERVASGVTFYEHGADMRENCDMMMRFEYDDTGRRFLEIETSAEIAGDDAYRQSMLPLTYDPN